MDVWSMLKGYSLTLGFQVNLLKGKKEEEAKSQEEEESNLQEEENTMKQEVSASSNNQSFVGPSYNVDKRCVLKHKCFKYDKKNKKNWAHAGSFVTRLQKTMLSFEPPKPIGIMFL